MCGNIGNFTRKMNLGEGEKWDEVYTYYRRIVGNSDI